MFISYAQNFEDVILWRALKHIPRGFYVDIGAQDPIVDSVSRGFYEQGWRGIHIEPTPAYAEKLRQDRPDEVVVQAAIGASDGNLRFFEFPQTGLSTGDEGIAEKHRQQGFAVHEIEVSMRPLGPLLDRFSGRDVHWLKIDVEGMEGTVIESWPPCQVRPWIVVVEGTKPLSSEPVSATYEPILTDMGYDFVYFDGLNRFYLSQDHKELKKHFLAGPNVFDEYAIAGKASSTIANLLNSQISELTESGRRFQQLVDEQRENLEEKNEAAAKLQQTIDESSRAIVTLNEKLAGSESRGNALAGQMEAIYNSLSWRITAPLRSLKKLLWRG